MADESETKDVPPVPDPSSEEVVKEAEPDISLESILFSYVR